VVVLRICIGQIHRFYCT